ncbi:MAG: hypothetical protein C0626_04305 [Arcobacter sp.]|uniref:hypothetical protein n=1 Tax=uncultured Arcobacter sp. TaxID=165434 RepID=UPI000CC963F8|nr:hypothetical protein [uncultured Arcobacter sp.]PLY10860.1 MAG: hypothetical protein C0626_04305 [Arcobacter sp.]
MFIYYILGNTYIYKEEIKKLKLTNKGFKKWWKYNKDFKSWELEVSNVFNTKKFEDSVRAFCKEYTLELKRLENPRGVTKSSKDFYTPEVFFEYFHGENSML